MSGLQESGFQGHTGLLKTLTVFGHPILKWGGDLGCGGYPETEMCDLAEAGGLRLVFFS